MKVCKGLLLLCFLGILISSCFNPPEFSKIPEISVEKIQFKETPEVDKFDTLVLYLNFSDGDGDLGFDLLDSRYSDVPYNDSYYFVADGSGGLTKVTTQTVYTTDGTASFDLLNVPYTVTGKIATDQTRNLPGYDTLPVYNPASCLNYSLTELLIPQADHLVDATYNIIDTLYDENNDLYFLVEEPFLYERNIYHYNIDVRFFKYVGGSVGFEEYDWFKKHCIDFNGRFPDLTNHAGSPVSGTMRYAMTNSSFIAAFGNTPIKLKIKIRDRALNTSKEIETPQFVLRR